MMDFENILSIASQNQGLSSVQQKRYSLQTGPPKKDPKVKGVNSTAVQAFLKKQELESKKKEMQFKKQKDELLAKRVELKSDRKARAMASRTKDNFKGYNGIPVFPDDHKKRRSKGDTGEEKSAFESYNPEDDEDNYEYEQTDSEPEPEPEPLRPGKSISGSSSGKPSSKKSGGPPKAGPSPLNFADLLKLAEKKQHEPVELKRKPVKSEERLRTAEEIRELELERNAKRHDKGKESRSVKERDSKSQSCSGLLRKSIVEKEQKNGKPQKNSSEKASLLCGSGMKSKPTLSSDKSHSSSKPSGSDREREKPKTSHNDRDRSKTSLSSSSGALSSKVPSKGASSQVPAKQVATKPSSVHRPSTTSDLSSKKGNASLLQGRSGGISGTRPPGSSAPGQKSHQSSSGQPRPIQGSSVKGGPTGGSQRPGKGEPLRPGSNSIVKSSGNGPMRPSSGGPPKPGSQPQARHGGTHQAKAGGAPQARPGGSSLPGHSGGGGIRPPGSGLGRPSNGGPVPGRPAGSACSGPGRPKCTVVSETISSKNFGGPRPGVPPRPGMPPQRPGMAPRPGMPPRPMNRPPGTMLPPITSAYKRKYEDEEDDYDSEMDDFIDDGGAEQDEISKHIREIFGYDRTRYRDESDYALKYMESSWKDMQKEEARSLRMAVQEDLEEEKREAEELKQKIVKKKKLK